MKRVSGVSADAHDVGNQYCGQMWRKADGIRSGIPHPEEPRSGVSKDGRAIRASWFETREAALLTMRI
jgi:hypothetical protein